jgi:ATP-dependent Clp protease protease subunit
MKKSERIFAAAKKGSVLELLVYDIIGQDWYGDGICVANVAAQIKDAGEFESFVVRINSPGGNMFEGVAIANLLRAQKKPVAVFVDGVAASAASVLAMAGDTISMGQGTMMMIHNASTYTYGAAAELRKTADTLDKASASMAETYATRTGKPVAEIQSLMDAETWLSAADCVEQGFATGLITRSDEETTNALALASTFTKHFANAPDFGAPTDILSDPQPVAEAPVDWEGQLSVFRKRLELIGK